MSPDGTGEYADTDGIHAAEMQAWVGNPLHSYNIVKY